MGTAVSSSVRHCRVHQQCFEQDIKDDLVSIINPKGQITNPDLEFVGLLLLWFVMEDVCTVGATPGCHVGLYSDSTPTVHWVQKNGVMELLGSDAVVAMLGIPTEDSESITP